MSEDPETLTLLTQEEARVLGCLLEKEATTPDVYPLTINSLITACNQKTNRQPVVDYSEETVAEAIEGLRAKQLAFRIDGAGSRVPKYRHNVDEKLGLIRAGKALLTVLLLRGPQTLGELRTRTERMHSFLDTGEVETELQELQEEISPPLWHKLPQAPGQKEARYQHLLCGLVEVEMASVELPSGSAMTAVQNRNTRIDALEEQVSSLEAELSEFKSAFEQFKKQFD
ncbi:MAG: YceH family protein [Opitutaceae bacterium]